jgi:hypothetical protein
MATAKVTPLPFLGSALGELARGARVRVGTGWGGATRGGKKWGCGVDGEVVADRQSQVPLSPFG